jgi:hypothetical protein
VCDPVRAVFVGARRNVNSRKECETMRIAGLLLSTALASAGALAAPASAPQTTRHDYELAAGLVVLLDVPDSWAGGIADKTGQRVPSILFASGTDPRFQVLLSVVPMSDLTAVEARVQKDADQYAPTSVEGKAPLQDVNAPHGKGWYFSVTDKQYADPKSAVPAGEFKYLAQGAVIEGPMTLLFSVLTNDDSRSVEAAALAMIRKAAIRQDGGST